MPRDIPCVVLCVHASDNRISYSPRTLTRNIVVVVDVAGTLGCAVLPFKSYLVGYNSAACAETFYIATVCSVQRALETVALFVVTALVVLTVTAKSPSKATMSN